MEESAKRDGGVGALWHALLGKDYLKQLTELVASCIKNPQATRKLIGEDLLLIDATYTPPIQLLIVKEAGGNAFRSIVPRFASKYETVEFEIDKVDEWTNGVEATLEGSIFDGRMFSCYCQNYLELKGSALQGKRANIRITAVARHGELLPVDKRVVMMDEGPFKGKEIHLDNMRYLSPNTEGEAEFGEFGFPIQDVETASFLGTSVYKLKGVLSNGSKDYFYDVYIHPSLVQDGAELKIGEPFHGWGWIQAEVMGMAS